MLKYTLDDVPSFGKLKGGSNSTLCKLALCLCIMLLTSCTKHYDNPVVLASELVDAFVDADVKKAQSITVPEQWDRIEEWMKGREPFNCRGGEWDTTGTGGTCYHTADNERDCSLVYQCSSERTPYCLEVNDILVKETENGWEVYDWGKICEAFDYAYKCGELCGDYGH
ncbi:MAG: hypothetical protein DRP85_09170 [Candidatus Makaraimicrobium thalassicum]|nr:MAG: hypothetical protein DRP85_09170 [Candidatus Omnitrophota bacterium]